MANLDVPLIFSVLAFLGLLSALWGSLNYQKKLQKRKNLKARIRQSGSKEEAFGDESEGAQSENSVRSQVESYLAMLGGRLVSEQSEDFSKTKQKFLKAGLYNGKAPHLYWGAKCFLLCLSVSSFLLLRVLVYKVLPVSATLIIVSIIAVLFFYMPNFWLHLRIVKRQKSIRRGLPDALDLLVVCVEAGMGIDLAFRRVANEMELSNKELSDELKLVNLELRAGKSRQKALRNLGTRVDIEELKSLVTLLIQTDQFGTSLSQGLRVYSDSFRTARFQRAEEIAAKLPVKLVFPCILFILPSLIVVIMGPALIRLFELMRAM
jgi:tight adherence protein C